MNKEETIKDICKLICATCAQFDGCAINCKAHRDTAETLYSAGYRKVPDCAVILMPEERDEELKACNEKQAELEAKIEILKIQNNNLEIAFDRLNARSERFESNMKSVLEIEKRNAVEEFAKKCKERINADYVNGGFNNHKGHLTEYDIDELIKEFTE